MVRYHNKTLQIKIIQDVSYKPGATRARTQQLESTKLAEAIVSEYRKKEHMICLKKASTKSTLDRKGKASCLGTSKLFLVKGELDVVVGIGGLHVMVVGIGDLLLLDSKAPTSTAAPDQAKQKKGGNKAGEYLVYPRVLRPL